MEILTLPNLCEDIRSMKSDYGTERCDRAFSALISLIEKRRDIDCMRRMIDIYKDYESSFKTLYPIIPDSKEALDELVEQTKLGADTLVPLTPLTNDVYSSCEVWSEADQQSIVMLTFNGVVIRKWCKLDCEIEAGLCRDVENHMITWRNVKTMQDLAIRGGLYDSYGPFRLFYKYPDTYVTVYNMNTEEKTRYDLDNWPKYDRGANRSDIVNGTGRDHQFVEFHPGLLHTGEPYMRSRYSEHVHCPGSLDEFWDKRVFHADSIAFDDKLVFFEDRGRSSITVVDRSTGKVKGVLYAKFTSDYGYLMRCESLVRYRNGILSCYVEVQTFNPWSKSHVERRWSVDASNIKRALYLYRARPRGLPSELVKRVAIYLCYALK